MKLFTAVLLYCCGDGDRTLGQQFLLIIEGFLRLASKDYSGLMRYQTVFVLCPINDMTIYDCLLEAENINNDILVKLLWQHGPSMSDFTGYVMYLNCTSWGKGFCRVGTG